jgi:ankyrin repeat protein
LIHLNCTKPEGVEQLEEIRIAYDKYNQEALNCDRRGLFLNHLMTFDTSGAQPIHLAAECLNMKIIDWLVSQGVNPHLSSRRDGNKAIHVMCSTQHEKNKLLNAMKYFIEKYGKKSLNSKNILGQRPLHVAVSINGNADLIHFLIEQGADPTLKDNNGKTPLEVAISKKCKVETVKALLTSNVCNAMNEYKRMELFTLACNLHLQEVAKLLMKKLHISPYIMHDEPPRQRRRLAYNLAYDVVTETESVSDSDSDYEYNSEDESEHGSESESDNESDEFESGSESEFESESSDSEDEIELELELDSDSDSDSDSE